MHQEGGACFIGVHYPRQDRGAYWLGSSDIAALVNRTDVEISTSGIRVFSGPAPWVGNKEVSVEDITAVMVRERSGNRGRSTYNVMYADRTQKERKLVAWLSESDQAKYIAATIRDTLGLETKDA